MLARNLPRDFRTAGTNCCPQPRTLECLSASISKYVGLSSWTSSLHNQILLCFLELLFPSGDSRRQAGDIGFQCVRVFTRWRLIRRQMMVATEVCYGVQILLVQIEITHYHIADRSSEVANAPNNTLLVDFLVHIWSRVSKLMASNTVRIDRTIFVFLEQCANLGQGLLHVIRRKLCPLWRQCDIIEDHVHSR